MPGKIKHGMCGTRIYDCYRDMLYRCYKPYNNNYKHYGFRGIKVCQEWQGEHGFETFYKWAITNGYSDDLTIDRINVDGNYEPSNCRWSTKSVQNANRRKRPNTQTEYIGVSIHSGGGFNAMIKKNDKRIFIYHSRSKNECARARNEFIINNNLNYPLNEIKDEYEIVVPYKTKKIGVSYGC